MQCGIDYFQEWNESKDPSEEALKLLKYARKIAVGTQTLERIDGNLEGLQEWIDSKEDRELNEQIGEEI